MHICTQNAKYDICYSYTCIHAHAHTYIVQYIDTPAHDCAHNNINTVAQYYIYTHRLRDRPRSTDFD